MQLFTCVVVGSLCILTQAAASQSAQTYGKPTRLYATGTWEVVRQIGLHDDLLDKPGPIASDGRRVVFFDFGTSVVKSIRLDGTVEWKAGRRGAGPGEYANPTSLQLDDAGRAIIYDPEAARITVLDAHGKLVRTVPLKSRFDAALPAGKSNEFVLVGTASDVLTTLADSTPTLRSGALAPPQFRDAARITKELAGSISTAQGHLLAFRWTSLMMLIDNDGRVLRSCEGIDSLSLPPVRISNITFPDGSARVYKVDSLAKEAARDIAVLANAMVILRRRTAPEGRMTLDLYEPGCGRYRESRWLPFPASSIAGNTEHLVAVVIEPVPHLVVLRWRP